MKILEFHAFQNFYMDTLWIFWPMILGFLGKITQGGSEPRRENLGLLKFMEKDVEPMGVRKMKLQWPFTHHSIIFPTLGNPFPKGCSPGGQFDSNPYGTCCGRNCGAYLGGKSALEHYIDGAFGVPPQTVWKRGAVESVYLAGGFAHGGFYGFRLCQVPSGGIAKITEDCFRLGHLEFSGSINWMYDKPWKNFDSNNWQNRTVQTRNVWKNGKKTIWRKVIIPKKSFWAIRDDVKVPSNLSPGDYVLSYRWDCQKTPQVWSSCANIKIVAWNDFNQNCYSSADFPREKIKELYHRTSEM